VVAGQSVSESWIFALPSVALVGPACHPESRSDRGLGLPQDDPRGLDDYFGQPDWGSAGVSFRAFL